MRVRRCHRELRLLNIEGTACEHGAALVGRAGEYSLLDERAEHVVLDCEFQIAVEFFDRRKFCWVHRDEREVGLVRLDVQDALLSVEGDLDVIPGQPADHFAEVTSRNGDFACFFDIRDDSDDDADFVIGCLKF